VQQSHTSKIGYIERLGVADRLGFDEGLGGLVCLFIVSKCGELDKPHGSSTESPISPETTT